MHELAVKRTFISSSLCVTWIKTYISVTAKLIVAFLTNLRMHLRVCYSCTDYVILVQTMIFLYRLWYSCTDYDILVQTVILVQTMIFFFRLCYSCTDCDVLVQTMIFFFRLWYSCTNYDILFINRWPANSLPNVVFFLQVFQTEVKKHTRVLHPCSP